MATINPIQRDQIRTVQKEWLPICVKCVLDELDDYNDVNIHAIRDYCIQLNVMFDTRLYDSDKYHDDRDVIERLPAYHVYINRRIFRTFYPNTRPYQHIQESIQYYKDGIEARKRRRHRFQSFIASIITMFRNLGKRKTKMEKVKEQEQEMGAMSEQKRKIQSEKERTAHLKRINEWN